MDGQLIAIGIVAAVVLYAAYKNWAKLEEFKSKVDELVNKLKG